MSKQLLRENIEIKAGDRRALPLTESTSVFNVNGQKVRALAAFSFPTSRPDKLNLNDRIYNTPLWNRVILLGQGIGAFGLTDHPEDGGSVKDTWCVWQNPRIEMFKGEKVVMVDAYLFGKWGQHALDALNAGGTIGLSSVGYGEFLADNKTIDPETFELVRFADWVLDPSYAVFGDKTKEIPEEKQENVEKKLPSAKSEDVNKKENSMKRTIEEKTFRLQMEGILKDIKKESDLGAKKKALTEGLSFFEGEEFCEDLQTKFDEELISIEEEVSKLAEKGKDLDKVVEEKSKVEKDVTILEAQIEEVNMERVKLAKTTEEASVLADSLKVVVAETRKNLEEAENLLKVSFTAEEVSKIKEDYENRIKTMFTAEEVSKIKEAKAEDEPKKDDSDPKDKKDKDEPKKDESFVDPRVASYYESLRDSYPAVVKIKEEILGCKTLVEAQKKFMNLSSVVFESAYARPSALLETKTQLTKEQLIPTAPRVLPTVKRNTRRDGWV